MHEFVSGQKLRDILNSLPCKIHMQCCSNIFCLFYDEKYLAQLIYTTIMDKKIFRRD